MGDVKTVIVLHDTCHKRGGRAGRGGRGGRAGQGGRRPNHNFLFLIIFDPEAFKAR